MKRRIRRSLGFLSHLDGVDGAHSGSGAHHRHDQAQGKTESGEAQKSSGRKDGSDDEPEEELDPELAALLARKTDAAAQLKEVNIHTGLVTKSGAKSKAVLEKERKLRRKRKHRGPVRDDDDIDLNRGGGRKTMTRSLLMMTTSTSATSWRRSSAKMRKQLESGKPDFVMYSSIAHNLRALSRPRAQTWAPLLPRVSPRVVSAA